MCAWGRVLAEPRLSPDGSTVAVAVTAGGRGHLALVPAEGGAELTLTTSPAVAPAAAYGGGVFDWHPDGESLVYVGSDGGLYVQAAAGGPPRPVDARWAGLRAGGLPGRVEGGLRARRPGGGGRLAGGRRSVAGPPLRRRRLLLRSGVVSRQHPGGLGRMGRARHALGRQSHRDRARRWLRSAPAPSACPHRSRPVNPGSRPTAPPSACSATVAVGSTCGGATPTAARPRPLLAESAEHGGPSWGPGERSWVWSPDGRQIAFCRNEGGFGRLCLLDVGNGAVRDLDRGVYGGLSWSGDLIAGIRSGARTPTQVVVLEPLRRAKSRRSLMRGPVAGFEAAGLVEPEVVSWESEECAGVGTTVHGRLYRADRRAGPEGDDGRPAAAGLGPRRTDRPEPGDLEPAGRLLRGAGVERAAGRPPRFDRLGPGLRPGPAGPVGPP